MSKAIFSTAYLPPVSYFEFLKNSEEAIIEGAETYQKQTYRTRCYIYAGNGPLLLGVPVEKLPNDRRYIRDLKVDYSKKWLQLHQRALISAYNSSPFFEYYFYDDLLPIYEKKPEFLFDLNLEFIRVISDLMGISTKISVSDDFDAPLEDDVLDLRSRISPKKESLGQNRPYYQVFTEKYGFIPELSIVDLLFNEGPDSISYL